MQIIPAILPRDYMELIDKFETLKDFSTILQIDFCDGIVGQRKTYIPKLSDPLSFLSSHQIQCDLMVKDWEALLPILSKVFSLHSVVAHITKDDIDSLKKFAEWSLDESIGFGVSITNDEDIQALFSAYEVAMSSNPHTFIQVMGIRVIGKQGEPFDPESEKRIREIRSRLPDVYIQVDGSMSPEYARRVKEAGADAVVVGSYLFSKPVYECFEEYAEIKD